MISIFLQFGLPLVWVLVAAMTLTNFIEIFRLWPSKRLYALVPVVLSLVTLFGGDDVQFMTKVLHFKYYQDDYEKIIEMIRSNEIDLTVERMDNRVPIPDGLLPTCYAMHAGKGADNTVSATFFLGGGFPVKHSGVRYVEATAEETHSRGYPIPLSPRERGRYYFWRD